MNKKTTELVNRYIKVLELHRTSSTNLNTIATMYRSKFSCMEDLGLMTHEECIHYTALLTDILFGGEE